MSAAGQGTTGFLLGKFLPPHRGHQFLIDFARAYVDRLTVLACSIAREPIPGALRFQWMQEAFPGVTVIHHSDELPQTPDEHPAFWDLWRASIRRHVPGRIDYVFASETYGWRLAEELGADFVPVDLERRSVPVSGSAIRADPMGHWNELLAPVRPYYLKRVCVLDSAERSLAWDLAAAFNTCCAHSGVSPLRNLASGTALGELARTLRRQSATESALARQSHRLLICDGDLLTLSLATDSLPDHHDRRIPDENDIRPCDLYLAVESEPSLVEPARTFVLKLRDCCRDRRIPFGLLRGARRTLLADAQAAIVDLIGSRTCADAPD